MKTLYKLDSKKKMRTWSIWTSAGYLIQESGLKGGKLVQNSKLCTPKNVGKANETTPDQQAELELKSAVLSKLDEGYFETEELAESEEVVLPMLAKSYDDYKHKIDWDNCFIQPKLDGQRVLAIKREGKVKLISRDGKQITTLAHIVEQLEHPDIPDNIYDGEAYNLELGTFQDQMKAIKKYTKGLTEKINFNIYDIISEDSYEERFNKIRHIFDREF